MARRRAAWSALLVVVLLLGGCVRSAPAASDKTLRVGSLKGPTTMGLVKLQSDAAAGRARGAYEFTVTGTPDE